MIKPTRGRPRSFDQNEVIEDVMVAFWKHGYDSVSMDMLCKLTKLSKPSFYNAFESKEKLFCLCLKKYQEKYAAPLLGHLLSESNRVLGYKKLLVAANHQFCQRNTPTGCLVLTGALEAKGKGKSIDRVLLDLQTGIFNSIAAYFDSHAVAQFVFSQLYAMAMFSRTDFANFDFNEFQETSVNALKALLK